MKNLEKILEQKEINEQAKNLLQGILYKVEVSYKDYKKVKGKKKKEEKYIQEISENIEKKCSKITIVRPSQKVADEEIQKALEENKFYVGDEIVSYPIEEKILYAIEKKSNNLKILNNRYEEAAVAISDLINVGKNMDRVEVLRDFNGWSWTTIPKEIENIEANLIYQTLQIVLGEEFLDNWCADKDGIIDYLELLAEELGNDIKELLVKLAMVNTAKYNNKFGKNIIEEIRKTEEELKRYENTQELIEQVTSHKKQLLKELNEVEKILAQETKIKELAAEKNIFNLKILKTQLNSQKQELLEKIEKDNDLLKPSNYLDSKNKLISRKEMLEQTQLGQEETEKTLIQFIEKCLHNFEKLIDNTTDEEEIVRLIYQLRYFLLLPFNLKKSIKDVAKLKKSITETQKKLVEKAIKQKVITEVPFEIMKHVFETRIIILEELYYKITSEEGKHHVQIFDENISEEAFEIKTVEKARINKKLKIFI